MGKQFFCALILTLTPAGLALCQDVNVRGQFQVDSIAIGSVFPYSLSLKYPKNYTVLFPDSLYSFSPFELHHKTFFPTQTKGDVSYDSVVYFLSSFAIDSVQKLRLPIFIAHRNDCTRVYAQEDSVLLTYLVEHVPDSVSAQALPLKTNTAYRTVKWQLNYPIIIIVGFALIVVAVGIWLIFGKSIRKYFLLRKLTKKHLRFTHSFEASVTQLKLHYSTDRMQSATIIWKRYMEDLLAKPFTKYTSKEIFQFVEDNSLYKALKQVDQRIYSRKRYVHADDNLFFVLQDFSEDCFQKKIMEIKNG